MLEEIYKETKDRMSKTIEVLKSQLNKIRTGRASPSILDDIKINYYSSLMPLRQIATISAPDPRLLIVQPWDKTSITSIIKAIQEADLGLNPSSDGNIIRIPIPPLSEERRLEFVKLAKKITEESKIALRNIRHDSNDLIKDLEKEKEISEDDKFRALDEIQKITDEFIKKTDEILLKKEKEVMEE